MGQRYLYIQYWHNLIGNEATYEALLKEAEPLSIHSQAGAWERGILPRSTSRKDELSGSIHQECVISTYKRSHLHFPLTHPILDCAIA